MHYNLVNESMNAKMSSTKPFVGMCGTMFCGSDRWPYVVTEVFTNKKIRMTSMSDEDYNSNRPTNEDGIEFLYNIGNYVKINDDKTKIIPKGKIYTYRKNKRWICQGKNAWETGSIHLGKADLYRDPDF